MASVNDDSLGDFTNDLSSDIAPLIALFGERMTVQYLSESTSFLDYFIFAMAPIGIITAIVSTIRLCGNAALRAFIGRSQEGEGTVEAELCTSTSRDVCELFTNGGVQRVLGRPSILELVYIEDDGAAPTSAIGGNVGLHLSKNYFQDHTASETTHWKRVGKRSSENAQPAFAPNPNISLNIGVKKQPTWVFWTIAAVGLFTQMGVIVLAAVGVWVLDWDLDEGKSSAKIYAPTMYITGSILLCIGMWSCAALIGQTTDEIRFKRNSEHSPMRARLLWLQPGPQVIGDQTFDPYAYLENPEKDPLHVWTSSSKNPHPSFEVPTFLAILATLVGYVVQFIGLRGLKGWVSLTQLGITILMSLLRGLLRIKRIGTESNALAKMPDLVAGHELDWITSEIIRKEDQDHFRWHVTGQHAGAFAALTIQTNAPQTPAHVKSGHNFSAELQRLFQVRLQLAHLTGNTSLRKLDDSQYQVWENQYVKVRDKAGRVASAICKATTELVKSGGQRDITLRIEAASSYSTKKKITHQAQLLDVTLEAPDEFSTAGWRMDSAQLEAIMGLWVWTMMSDERLLYENDDLTSRSDADLIQQARIVSAGEYNESWNTDDNIQDEMNLWLGRSAVTFREATLRRHDQESQGIAALFTDRLGGSLPTFAALEPSEMDEKCTLRKDGVHQDLRRFCGWSNVHPTAHSPADLRIQYSELPRGEASLLDLCAQELFTTLMLSLAEFIPRSRPVFVEILGSLRLEHNSVNAFVNAFQEAELGTAADAMLCVVPAMRQKLEPLDPVGLLCSIREAADNYRREGEWSRAETLVQWGCARFTPSQKSTGTLLLTEHFREAVRIVAELYRWSLALSVETKDDGAALIRADFGLYGLDNLFPRYINTSPGDSELNRIIETYEVVARQFRKRRNVDDDSAASALKDALESRDRAQGLYNLCFISRRTLNSPHQANRSFLPLAIRNDWPEVVNTLFELGAETNSIHLDESSHEAGERTALFYCAELGLLSYVQPLLDHGSHADEPSGPQLQTPISRAAEGGHLSIVQLLLKSELVMIDKKDKNGTTCLMYAVEAGHVDITMILLQHGADVEVQDNNGNTPLMHAIKRGHLALVNLLIEEGGVIERPNRQGLTPLMQAACNSDSRVVQLILDKGAEIDRLNNDGHTPLMLAIRWGEADAAELLISRGANLQLTGNMAGGPLTLAFRARLEKIVELLLDRDVDIGGNEDRGQVPLVEAAAWGRPGLVRRLLQRGAKIDEQEKRGGYSAGTALHAAARKGHPDVLLLLIESGVSLDLQDDLKERTALHLAAIEGHAECVKLLIERGANLEALDNLKCTALHLAVDRDHVECTRLLIEGGAHLEAKNFAEETPLHMAATAQRKQCVKLLVDAGAVVDTVNNMGEKPLSLIKKLLNDHGE